MTGVLTGCHGKIVASLKRANFAPVGDVPCYKTLVSFQEVKHGFPNKPTSMAWDGELKLLALATKLGAVRM
jgi:hypothetical protein